MHTLSVSCDCGALQGTLDGVSRHNGTRAVCYCRDCQAFAEFLQHSSTVLDAHGGTEVYQTLPSRLAITRGRDHLACVQLSDRGTTRWYAACCRAPLGNTLHTRALPFVSLITTCLRAGPDGTTPDAAMGPSRGVVFPKGAWGEVSGRPSALTPGVFLQFASRTIGAGLFGDRRRNPFFEADGTLAAPPLRVSAQERARLDARLAERFAAAAVNGGVSQ